MFDLKNRRVFLKRCPNPNVTMDELYVGATVTVYARQLKITEYADVYTRNKFESRRGKALVLVKPEAYIHMGKILDVILSSGFKIT
jgi:nucleoside-diphosphate kinase